MASKKRRKKKTKTRVTELGKAVSPAAYAVGRARRKSAEEEESPILRSEPLPGLLENLPWETDEVIVPGGPSLR